MIGPLTLPMKALSLKTLLLSLTLCVGLGGSAFLIGLTSAPALAQLAVVPQEVNVTVEQHETTTRTVTLTNTSSDPLSFCLSFDRPLKRTAGAARISDDALGGASGAACGPYSEVLGSIGADEVPSDATWYPYGLTMTPHGRLFVADFGSLRWTHELTRELDHVRSFPNPMVEEVAPFSHTTGVTYNSDTESLWWLNVEEGAVSNELVVIRALLLEGDLNGAPTGRQVELPVAEGAPPPGAGGSPVGLSYDPARQWFYFTDIANEMIWAVDTLGNPAEGYPTQMEGYPGATFGRGLNALLSTGGADGADALRLELYVNPPGPALPRLGVVGRYGGDTAPGAEPLETFYASYDPNAETGTVNGEAVRSTLDPNGVLYYPWSSFEDSGIVAIRPHPLPPSWLVVEAWRGTLESGESTEIELTFRPGGRAVGEYTAVLQAFEAESGAAVEVPLTLAVTQGTDAEDEPATPEAPSLAVYPNPTSGQTTVALALDAAADVRVVVYDVLGRQAAVLHRGELAAGSHELALDGTALPAGVYLVKAEVGAQRFVERITLVR